MNAYISDRLRNIIRDMCLNGNIHVTCTANNDALATQDCNCIILNKVCEHDLMEAVIVAIS